MAPHGQDPLVSCSLRGHEAPGRLQGSLLEVTSSDLCGEGQGPCGEVWEQRASGRGPGTCGLGSWERALAGVWGWALCSDPHGFLGTKGTLLSLLSQGSPFWGGHLGFWGRPLDFEGEGQGSGVHLLISLLVLVDSSLAGLDGDG